MPRARRSGLCVPEISGRRHHEHPLGQSGTRSTPVPRICAGYSGLRQSGRQLQPRATRPQERHAPQDFAGYADRPHELPRGLEPRSKPQLRRPESPPAADRQWRQSVLGRAAGPRAVRWQRFCGRSDQQCAAGVRCERQSADGRAGVESVLRIRTRDHSLKPPPIRRGRDRPDLLLRPRQQPVRRRDHDASPCRHDQRLQRQKYDRCRGQQFRRPDRRVDGL